MKNLISIKDLSVNEINDLFELTQDLKENRHKYSDSLKGRTLALVFQKPSNRTRVSFAVGMFQLGGQSLYLSGAEINLGIREAIKDVAKTLSRYVDAIVLRTFEHQKVAEMAKWADVPVINGLSDLSHPCQALADAYTIKEKLGGFTGRTLAYIGDGNNVANSLIFCSAKLGLNFSIAAPKGFELKKDVLREAEKYAAVSRAKIYTTNKPADAVKGADIIYTDVWASMGQEEEIEKRKKIFKNYQINKTLVQAAKNSCLIMHCLPAHRGMEITDEVIDSPNSIVFDQAENRLHVQKAVLLKLLKG